MGLSDSGYLVLGSGSGCSTCRREKNRGRLTAMPKPPSGVGKYKSSCLLTRMSTSIYLGNSHEKHSHFLLCPFISVISVVLEPDTQRL